ncbi:sulfotransferase [Aestuariibaculum lutulentum]|uniref:Sulfotransferase n=1 Tax=Aestuariibaculum lutulentum TaxID=2920935 RepID=A0ABS9RGN7_9FLAO|nr:sulfotransferase [Aestuariibaculum lutulentum]MCH4552108.1 sulfotransferase [Aestuariibaculum lutulentum]
MKSKNFKKNIQRVIKIVSPKYEQFIFHIWYNRTKRLLFKTPENKFIFILCPPYCGSTLINQVVSSSSKVSVNNFFGTREGQQLPTLRTMMFDNENRWDENYDHDWKFIKNEWMKYWDITKPFLLEKSPSNILRAESIDEVFANSHYIITYRNPYAHCEGIMRRNKATAEYAANFTIKCLYHQKKNIEMLQNKVVMSYEEITTNRNEFRNKIISMLPELNDISVDKKFSAHNQYNKNLEISNLNQKQIEKLSKQDLIKINNIFSKEEELLEYFGYKLINF